MATLPIARAMVAAKVANQRAVLRRHLRDYSDSTSAETVGAVQCRLSDATRHGLTAPDLDTLRGQEGETGHACRPAFSHLIRAGDPAMGFPDATAARFDECASAVSLCAAGRRYPRGL